MFKGFNKGTLRVLSALLTNLAAGWLGSVVIFPGFFKITTTTEIVALLTYSFSFATLSLVVASNIENKLYD